MLVVPDEFPTIQAAIDASVSGDEVVVQPGVYIETITIEDRDIHLRSAGGSAVTEIRAPDQFESVSVVSVRGAVSTSAIVEGFTITNGRGDQDSEFEGRTGGGVNVDGFHDPDATPAITVRNCRITLNGSVDVSAGGGIFVRDGFASIEDCVIDRNEAGSACDGRGGGIAVRLGGRIDLIRCEIWGNEAYAGGACGGGGAGSGGGAYLGGGSRIINCIFRDNDVYGTKLSLPRGGAVRTWGQTRFFATTFAGNRAMVTFKGETTFVDGAAIRSVSGSSQVFGAIFTDHPSASLLGGIIVNDSLLDMEYSVGKNNVVADPVFEPGTFRLAAGSPGLDMIDAATYIVEGITSDFSGDPRLIDADAGGPGPADAGAYEFNPCPVDLNGDGAIDFLDALTVLSSWGPCTDCGADIDGDGTVDTADLLDLLASWGSSCA